MVDLFWSVLDVPSTTLEVGAPRRLNLFFLSSNWQIIPRVNTVPLRAILHCVPEDIFRFDVRVAAKECPPQFASIKVTCGAQWDQFEAHDLENDTNEESESQQKPVGESSKLLPK